MVMNNELKRTWKEAIMAYYTVSVFAWRDRKTTENLRIASTWAKI
jgi:hypothetical protein